MPKLNLGINRKGLQWQLLSRFFMILIVLFLFFGVSQYVSMRQFLYHNKNGELQLRFHNIDLKALSKVNTNDAVINNSAIIIKSLIGANISVSVVDSSGNIIAGSGISGDILKHKDLDRDNDIYKNSRSIAIPKLSKEEYLKLLKQERSLERTYYIIRDDNKVLQMTVWRKIGDIRHPSGLIQISSPVEDIQNILRRQIYIYIGGLILVLVLGSLLGGAVFKKTLDPLYNMTKTVENITVGELHTRLPEDNGLLEIDRLSESFNKMLNGIEISFQNEKRIRERMRQFVSDASHELRTPLTSIHGFVEVLLSGAAKNREQLNSALKSILIESERLTKLVQDLLTITRLDQGLLVEMSVMNINDVVREVYPQLQILSGERQVSLNLLDDLMVKINKDQIKQVIFNLTQNAVQYTDEKSGEIIISSSIEEINNKRFAAMKIADNGSGISEEHIDKIFDRFFRSEYHRSREHGGYGLGLSIVKSIVEAHGGKITVESTPGKGTVFTIYLTALSNIT